MRAQRRIITCSALLAAALAACGPRREPPPPYAPPAALVIAHRGGAALWPENTLVAFRNAVALGADVLELDVRATADGRLVVVHDATVDRTTDGRGAVATLTLAEVQRL